MNPKKPAALMLFYTSNASIMNNIVELNIY